MITLDQYTVDDSAVASLSQGQLLLQFRQKLGWTQRTLSEKVGCSIVMVCQWETGKRPISVQSVLKLKAAMGLDLRQSRSLLADTSFLDTTLQVLDAMGEYELGRVMAAFFAEGTYELYDHTALRQMLNRLPRFVRQPISDIH